LMYHNETYEYRYEIIPALNLPTIILYF
jgi:hypothetical protein